MASETADAVLADEDSNTYYLEEVSIDDDEDLNTEEFAMVAEEEPDEQEEDNFAEALNTLKSTRAGLAAPPKTAVEQPAGKAGMTNKPTVMDDFVRNFLIKLNMERTLDAFNTEWYEMKEQGKLNTEDIAPVADLYQRNESLDDQVKMLREEVEKANEVAEKARGTWDKFRKERDFHRMHHRRVVQEKNILVRDMKRLQKHYATFEPALKAMRGKYELAMKDKMLMKLERDRCKQKLAVLEQQAETLAEATQNTPSHKAQQAKKEAGAKEGGETKKPAGKKAAGKGQATVKADKEDKGAVLPPDDRINPHLHREYAAMPAERMRLNKTYKGHAMAVSGIAIHPSKPIVATVSDDRTWKMWSVSRGELIMSGDGHKDWIGACDFHPGGGLLATASGDGTVKLWDFVRAKCTATLTDHSQAVWDCAFHDTGDFLASASMDHTARVFDVTTGKLRQTIRGHVDSVNKVTFQPFSNNICTASGDKTVSLWDVRSGLCIQTFYGHENAVLAAAFAQQGDTIASADSDGIIKLWDVRMVAERATLSAPDGRVPVNDVKFDLSGKTLLAACDDATIKVFSAGDGSLVSQLEGHEDAVQALAVDPKGKYVLGASSDQTWRVFQA